jgi:threonyl-tRNA synthetase
MPTWLAPTQVTVLPVKNEYHLEYAKKVDELLRSNHVRTKLDDSDEKLGYRMRESQVMKIPYTLVLGNNERDENTVTYRKFGSQEKITISLDEFMTMLKDEIENKK